MNCIVLGKAHRALCDHLTMSLSAVNILSLSKSTVHKNRYLIHYEHNARDQSYEYIYLDSSVIENTLPLIRKSNTVGYYISGWDCDASNISKFRYAELPEVKVIIDDKVNTYTETVKKLIAVSFLSFFDVAKLLYPGLFQSLASRYNSFHHALFEPDKLNSRENQEQDLFIKLLTIFDITVPQEVLYYQRMLELDGLITKLVDNIGLYYLNGYKDTWLPVNLGCRKALAIKYANQLLKQSVKI